LLYETTIELGLLLNWSQLLHDLAHDAYTAFPTTNNDTWT